MLCLTMYSKYLYVGLCELNLFVLRYVIYSLYTVLCITRVLKYANDDDNTASGLFFLHFGMARFSVTDSFST